MAATWVEKAYPVFGNHMGTSRCSCPSDVQWTVVAIETHHFNLADCTCPHATKTFHQPIRSLAVKATDAQHATFISLNGCNAHLKGNRRNLFQICYCRACYTCLGFPLFKSQIPPVHESPIAKKTAFDMRDRFSMPILGQIFLSKKDHRILGLITPSESG